MKLKSKKTHKIKSRPFLILPLEVAMPKNTGLKLFTKTWPLKRDNNKKEKGDDENTRPLTATLDKPTILDINFIGIIDMSTVRKEFLNISNLCRFPLRIKRKKTAVINRPLSLPSPEKKAVKNKKRQESEDESSVSVSIRSAKITKIPTTTRRIIDDKDKVKKSPLLSDANNNNNKTFKIPRKRVGTIAKLLDVKSDLAKSTKLPEPCKTCGRPDQPERFHSHPVTPLKSVKKAEEPPKMKSTVQKPVAIKYKSKQTIQTQRTTLPAQQRKPSLPSQNLVHTPPNFGANSSQSDSSSTRMKSAAKRTLTCHICAREFGSKSLPLHEPKCLEKWKRENDNLPVNLQRNVPTKPDISLTPEEWNDFAWKSSQVVLIPCPTCGRTFNPDRLIVHQRSCKIIRDTSNLKVEKSSPPLNACLMPPPSIECYICGKLFLSHSIKIHEKQCLKKWQLENNSLPADIRASEPTRKGVRKSPTPTATPESSSKRSSEEVTSATEKRPPMFPCYICGRLFTVNSIYIHEPQCLKMWKNENDKLPPSKRRPQPLKPDIKFTHDGNIDYKATNEAKWQSHLSLLVPCKLCARTFNPDRVEVHEKSCKG